MELAATPYLYVLAALSLSFGSLSSIVVLLRQMVGGTPPPHYVLLFRLVLESSLTNAVAAVLPPLFSLAPTPLWHLAGAIASLGMLAHFASYPRRRRRVAPDQLMGPAGWGNIAVLVCGPVLLALDATEIGRLPAGAVYALAFYLRLLASGCPFFANFAFFVRQDLPIPRAASADSPAVPPAGGARGSYPVPTCVPQNPKMWADQGFGADFVLSSTIYPLMRHILVGLAAMATVPLVGCTGQPSSIAGARSSPGDIVSTATPPGDFLTESGRLPVQTRNSLPPGAATSP
jgi:hypothetical protein